MTIPNFISIARLLSVPVIVWALIDEQWKFAFAVFLISGASDAVDGFIARHFNQKSTLGVYLDPMADKILLVSVFAVLGFRGDLPSWLVVLVISRDILIVTAVMLSFFMSQPITVKPSMVSKANTALQIVLVCTVLASSVVDLSLGLVIAFLIAMTALLTVLSAASYLIDWLRHMASESAVDPRNHGE